MVGETRCGWAGRLHGFSHLPGSGPASSKTRGATRSNSGQDHSLPELPASVRPPNHHARPQTGQDTGKTRYTDLRLTGLGERGRQFQWSGVALK